MRPIYAKILMVKAIIFAWMLAGAIPAKAFNAIERYQNQIQGKLKKGDTLLLKDEKFLNNAFDWKKIHNKTVSNLITFGLFRDSAVAMPKAFKCEIDVKVEYWSQPDQTDPIVEDHVKLEVNYDPTPGVSYKDAALYRFMNGHRVKITINKITSAELGESLPAIFRLNSEVVVERSYEMDPEAKLLPRAIIQQSQADGSNSQARMVGATQNPSAVSISWNHDGGPEEFDLEWTFIDEDSKNGQSLAGGGMTDVTLAKMFRNNATRVTVSQNSYDITLVHYSKYLIFRMRQVQYDDNDFRVEYPWTYKMDQNGVEVPAVIVLDNVWHQPNLNWDYNAVYVEEGKKREVVSYFDGTLRSRQTVTVNNSDNKAVVQESIYDEFGRPLASILPAPKKENAFQYYTKLHLAPDNSIYNFKNIYNGTGACINTPLPLSSDSGAARYYSPNNDFLADNLGMPENKYIPDAEGYPFAVTRYTPDNTDRVSIQGSVGKLFQPGPDNQVSKATRYYYSKPEQWELNRLFGNDVGYASHYLKEMLVDPNGQIRITYQNSNGKTIATALAGTPPSNVDRLPSTPDSVEQTILLVNKEFSFDPAKLRISATSTYMNAVIGEASVSVNTPQLVMKYAENNVNICSNCYYELKIVVTDDCNKVVYKTTNPIKIGRETGECVTNGYANNTTFPVDLEKIGEYYFSFELGMKEDVINAYTNAYVDQNANLNSEWSFMDDALKDKNFFSCFNDCVTCKESLGQLSDFSARIKQRLEANGVDVVKNASDINDWINGLYSSLSTQCAALRASCTSSPCADLENTMQQDVSPGGQYALFDYKTAPVEPQINVLNLHWREVFPIKDTTSAEYQKELIYLPDGNRISPYDPTFTLQMLVTNWKSDWAGDFVKFHPEYCALEFCRDNSASFTFDERIKTLAEKVTDIQDIVPGAIYSRTDSSWLFKKDPFFLVDGLGYPYREDFLNDLAQYSTRVLGATGAARKGLSGFVDYMLYCTDYTGNTNLNNIATKEGNNWASCRPSDDCRVEDREWSLYRQKYLELKDEYYQKLRNTAAYCGEQCEIGTPYSYGQSDCPDPSKFVFSVLPNRCAGEIYNNVMVTYLGTPLKVPVSIDIYYPKEYDGLPDVFRPRNRTLPAGTTKTNFCLDTTVAVSSMKVTNVNCGVAARTAADGFCSTIGLSDFTITIKYFSEDNHSEIKAVYNGPAIPAGGNITIFGDHATSNHIVLVVTSSDNEDEYIQENIDLRTTTFKLSCSDGGGNPDPGTCDPAYKYKISRIGDISYDLPAVPTDTNALKAMSDAAIAKMVADNCERQAEEWMNTLRPCIIAANITSAKQLDLKNKLLEICKTGGDLTHPYGATNLPADRTTSTGVNSFEAAINSILGTNPDRNMICSYNLIDAPFPYVNNITQVNATVQQQAVSVAISKTNPAICDHLAALTAEFNASHSSGTLFTYLQGKYGASMTITQDELASLQKGCQNCRFLLNKDIILPVFLDGNAKGCVGGTEFLLAWNKLLTDMDAAGGKMPVTDPNYEKIVTNYFNGIFGFTLAFYDYKKFIDAVTAGSPATKTLCNRPVYSTVKQDDYGCMMEVIDDATSTGHVLYTEYIEEIKKKFRKDYIAYCGAVKPRVAMTSWQQNYHYTLYYYDQAGNLVRTVPPEGVHPLDNGLSAQIDAIRDQQQAGCNYNGPVVNANMVEVKQKLTAALDLTTNEAMEMWIYNSNGEGGQFLTTTSNNKYLVNACVNGSRLSFEVYSITPSTDAREADITLTGQSYADISNLLPLQPWTHIVLQGQGLNRNGVNVYVNGIKCPLIIPDKPVCGWEITVTSAAIKYPENLSSLKHLRLYNRQLTAEEIAANAKEGCFWLSPAYLTPLTNALTYPARFNMPAAGAPGTIGGGTTETRSEPIYPLHTLTTSYAYQSLNAVETQKTPDAGTSRFWYDRRGRLVALQNAEQLNSSSAKPSNRFTYTKYDEHGRPIEVGEKTGATTPEAVPFLSASQVNNFLAAGTNGQLTKTFYDVAYAGADASISGAQTNLRKRVTATTFEETDGIIQQATYYSYDLLGNVKTLWQQLDGLDIKQIDYQYDFVSGKVNKARYQYAKPDQFFYKYEFDAANRLTKALTGIYKSDNAGWDIQAAHSDAGYRYYLHGTLARTELGADQFVQGIDYAYTLQGWLKGTNGNYLEAVNEVGKDGTDNYGRKTIGRDVYAYSLDYFRGDYKPIGTTDAKAFPLAWDPASKTSDIGYDLFDGNISRSSLTLKNIGESKPVGYSYRYDQLSRLKGMRHHELTSGGTTWSTLTSDTAFKEAIIYDGNGNILSYWRNGSKTQGEKMDQLTYIYPRDASGNLINNRLTQVLDEVANSPYQDDIESQSASNYIYDNIGNLVKDVSSGITHIDWTATGKIKKICKSDNSSLEYRYDVAGNRVYKQYKDSDGKAFVTWYVRDAKGNIIATYGKNDGDSKTYWKDQQLYGSGRLGVWNVNSQLSSTEIADKWIKKGNKNYELTNHLGNVLATISDKVVEVKVGENVDHYEAEVITAQDYYTFGMLEPDREFSLGNYRYGFNGKEIDNEVKGVGNQLDFGARIYDPRTGRFLSVDPLTKNYSFYSPYLFAGNSPIRFIDLDGEDPGDAIRLFTYIMSQVPRVATKVMAEKIARTNIGKAVGKTTAQVYVSGLGLMNGTNNLLSFGLVNKSFDELNLPEEYRGWYEWATLVGKSQPLPEGAVGPGGNSTPKFSLASNGEAVVSKVAKVPLPNNPYRLSSDANNDASNSASNKEPVPEFEPVEVKGGKGGKELNRELKKIVAGGGNPRPDGKGGIKKIENRNNKPWEIKWEHAEEYQVDVPGEENAFRILKLKNPNVPGGYDYAWTPEHYVNERKEPKIYPFKQKK